MTEPSIGRIVIYQYEVRLGVKLPIPAIIIAVRNGLLDLGLFSPFGYYVQVDVGQSDALEPNTWSWPVVEAPVIRNHVRIDATPEELEAARQQLMDNYGRGGKYRELVGEEEVLHVVTQPFGETKIVTDQPIAGAESITLTPSGTVTAPIVPDAPVTPVAEELMDAASGTTSNASVAASKVTKTRSTNKKETI